MQKAEVFEGIVGRAIADAEQVKCSLPDFRDGLKLMRAQIDERIGVVEDEIKLKSGG